MSSSVQAQLRIIALKKQQNSDLFRIRNNRDAQDMYGKQYQDLNSDERHELRAKQEFINSLTNT